MNQNGIIEVGHRVYSSLYGGRYGIVYAINGTQKPETVRQFCPGIVMGGNAEFDIVFKNGTISARLPESILRGVQWEILSDKDKATVQEIKQALAFAEETSQKKQEQTKQKEREKAERRDRIKKEHPYLEKSEGSRLTSPALAAKNIRKELSTAFPGIKFSIRSKSYTGGNSIDVSWLNGPTSQEVGAVTAKYQEGNFDGMEDIYCHNEENVWPDVFGAAKYVFETRNYPNEEYIAVIKSLCALNGIECMKPHYSLRLSSGEFVTTVVNKILAKASFPAGAKITGLERTDVTCGLIEEFYRVTYEMAREDGKKHDS